MYIKNSIEDDMDVAVKQAVQIDLTTADVCDLPGKLDEVSWFYWYCFQYAPAVLVLLNLTLLLLASLVVKYSNQAMIE